MTAYFAKNDPIGTAAITRLLDEHFPLSTEDYYRRIDELNNLEGERINPVEATSLVQGVTYRVFTDPESLSGDHHEVVKEGLVLSEQLYRQGNTDAAVKITTGLASVPSRELLDRKLDGMNRLDELIERDNLLSKAEHKTLLLERSKALLSLAAEASGPYDPSELLGRTEKLYSHYENCFSGSNQHQESAHTAGRIKFLLKEFSKAENMFDVLDEAGRIILFALTEELSQFGDPYGAVALLERSQQLALRMDPHGDGALAAAETILHAAQIMNRFGKPEELAVALAEEAHQLLAVKPLTCDSAQHQRLFERATRLQKKLSTHSLTLAYNKKSPLPHQNN